MLCVDCVSIYLAEPCRTNNQHLHHYRRRAFTALLEAHASHATPTKGARGQADQWWAGWQLRSLAARAPGNGPTPSPKKKHTIPVWARGVCVFSVSCHATRRWKQGQTDAQQASPSPPPGNFPCTFVSPLPHRMRHNSNTKEYIRVRHDQRVTPLDSTPPIHTHPTRHTKTCLTHPPTPISLFSPRAPTNSSSSTSEEVSRECSPVGKRRGGSSFAADVHVLCCTPTPQLACWLAGKLP